MKLYLDEDISARVAHALRERGYDVLSSHEEGNDGLSDEAQLLYAARQGMHLVTYNRKDYLALADGWFRAAKRFPKIMLFTEKRAPRSDIGAQVAALEKYLSRAAGDPNTMDCVDYECRPAGGTQASMGEALACLDSKLVHGMAEHSLLPEMIWHCFVAFLCCLL